jgi:ATP-GRASP peptide maturase of grasp-with-spasm system
MVLLITQENEPSGKLVADWITHLGGKYYNISVKDPIEIIEFIAENRSFQFKFKHKGTTFNITQFKSIWFRRGWFNVTYKNLSILEQILSNLEIKEITNHLFNELKTLQEYFYNKISQMSNVYGNVNKYNLNKLYVLELAFKVGFIIPEYCVTTSKSSFLIFKNKHKKQILSKSIHENISYLSDDFSVFHVNNIFYEYEIEQLPDYFQTTLFQVYYEKIFEIRVFVFGGLIYSMAIFSQQNEKTKTDYRNYDNQKHTRCLPYKLPIEIRDKITNLLLELQLNTASIDLIYTTDEQYVFLEVNPVGQFGVVSKSGNFFIEKAIATTLIT